MIYDWQAALVFVGVLIVATVVMQFFVFKVPALQRTLQDNRAQDRIKRKKDKYPPVVKANNITGLLTNLVFFIAIAPFFVTLEPLPLLRELGNVVMILMVYDFFYYLTHRFLFHGQGYFRKVHALHHQARSPTNIDAYYVHPLETFVGISLFMGTILGLGLALGPFHALTLSACFIIWTRINIINHNHVDLPYFPFKTLTWITRKHAVHHENMHMGNYATITLFYDKVFGTLD